MNGHLGVGAAAKGEWQIARQPVSALHVPAAMPIHDVAFGYLLFLVADRLFCQTSIRWCPSARIHASTIWLDRLAPGRYQSRQLSTCIDSTASHGAETLRGIDMPVHAIPADAAIADPFRERRFRVVIPASATGTSLEHAVVRTMPLVGW
jgi:hypothetical protein